MQETIENNAGGGPAVAVTSNPEASPVFQILSHEQIPLTKTRAFLLCLAAGGAFQLAYSFERLSFLIAVYLWCLIELTRLPSARQASYFGLLAGLLAFAPQLGFFWKLFGAAAIALWLISAFWIRMFLAAGRSCVARFGPVSAALLIPFFWLGFEFFRSELYYLRFSWLNAGYVFSNRLDWLPMKWLGNYGFGFVLVAAICLIRLLKPLPRRIAAGSGIALLAVLVNLPRVESPAVTSVT
ncbi:MAG TPA: hypothetical protein VFC07_02445, partial [Verrucomicrobiae bacterium]|nr:hypothetical protein [Verrucomicrobiae bacterium]